MDGGSITMLKTRYFFLEVHGAFCIWLVDQRVLIGMISSSLSQLVELSVFTVIIGSSFACFKASRLCAQARSEDGLPFHTTASEASVFTYGPFKDSFQAFDLILLLAHCLFHKNLVAYKIPGEYPECQKVSKRELALQLLCPTKMHSREWEAVLEFNLSRLSTCPPPDQSRYGVYAGPNPGSSARPRKESASSEMQEIISQMVL
ncbi:hypothetical protein Tco_0115060 [Tanacetum coccineum]